MRHEEGDFPGSSGITLFRQSWRPDAPQPRAAVALVHGVGEHSGRYDNLVGPLVEAGYAIWAFDQRGHGRSPGPRVHIDRWSQYRDDLAGFLALVANAEPGVPIVLYGHSMGALVVLDYLVEHGPAGVSAAVVSGAPIEPAGIASPALVAVARVLSGVTPRLAVGLDLDVSALSRDPAVGAAYVADPLVTTKATVRWGAESLRTVESVKRTMGAIEIPILVLHGEADQLNTAAGARVLYETMSSADKTLRLYPGGRHEPHNDIGHERVMADVIEWLAREPWAVSPPA